MGKGLDTTFVHYGIRKEDMQLIETLCKEHEVEFDWIQNLLKNYHQQKIEKQELDGKIIEKIIEEALAHIK